MCHVRRGRRARGECRGRGRAPRQHDAAAAETARSSILVSAAKALLAEDFLIVPEISLAAGQADEVAAAVAASPSLLDYLADTAKVELPVETRVERRPLVSVADMSGVDWRPGPRVGRARGELGVSCQTRTGGIRWLSASTRASTSIMLYPPLNRKYRVIDDFAAKVMARL